MRLLRSSKAFGGQVQRFAHFSDATNCEMTFSVFLPFAYSTRAPVPAIYCLAGLTCSDETFLAKAGALQAASEFRVALVCPDTSPRNTGSPYEDRDWDFGTGAGFYLNATKEPWRRNYNMYEYVGQELPELVCEFFQKEISSRKAIMGHSMGGHGALVSYLSNPDAFSSASAFAPICNPSKCPWGEKAFSGYLGKDRALWADYDATELVRSLREVEKNKLKDILIDQGSEDEFLSSGQLLPENLLREARANGIPITYRLHSGYDHSYFFVSSFVRDHIIHHAKLLDN